MANKDNERVLLLLPPGNSSKLPEWKPSYAKENNKSVPHHYTNHVTVAPSWRRYVGIFVKDGIRYFGKIIIPVELEQWAKVNNYSIERHFRIYRPVDPEKEQTEFAEYSIEV